LAVRKVSPQENTGVKSVCCCRHCQLSMPRARPLSAHPLALAVCVGAGRTHCCVVSSATAQWELWRCALPACARRRSSRMACRVTKHLAHRGGNGAPEVLAPLRLVASRGGDVSFAWRSHARVPSLPHGAVARAHDGGAAAAMMDGLLGDRDFALRSLYGCGLARAVASRLWGCIHLRLCALSSDGRCFSH